MWTHMEESWAWDQSPCPPGQGPGQHLGECKRGRGSVPVWHPYLHLWGPQVTTNTQLSKERPCVRCQQGLGTGAVFGVLTLDGGPAVTAISIRKSSHIQINPWSFLRCWGLGEAVQGTENVGTPLAVISMGFSESCHCRYSGSRGKSWLLRLMKDPINLPKT